MAKKQRLDTVLVQNQLASNAKEAERLIRAGKVLVNTQLVDTPGVLIDPQASIRIKDQKQYVSRGGNKLLSALDHFKVNVSAKVGLDIGASTGGFTDCLLQSGASFMHCVDVGTNQLAWKLREDSRVSVNEGINARELDLLFDPKPHFAVIDVSFISIRKVLERTVSMLEPGWFILALVKPQFELPREDIEQGGVVPSQEKQFEACELVLEYVKQKGWKAYDPFASALKGQKKGNQEYFLYFTL